MFQKGHGIIVKILNKCLRSWLKVFNFLKAFSTFVTIAVCFNAIPFVRLNKKGFI